MPRSPYSRPHPFVALLSTLLLFTIASRLPAATPTLLTEDVLLGDLPLVLSPSRLPQAPNEAPSSITVIDREMIDAYQPEELVDVLRLVPGMQVAHARGFRSIVTYHGLADEFTRQMQVLIDGRSVYTPILGHVEWSNIPLAVDDIDRIEVIRGPNAASYGANSFYGIINIVTRHSADSSGPYLRLTGGGRNLQQATARYGGRAGALSYRMTLGYQSDSGFESVEFPDDKEISLATVRGDYRLSDRSTLEFQFGYNAAAHEDGDTDPRDSPEQPPRIAEADTRFELLRWRHSVGSDEEFSIQFYHNRQKVEDTFFTAPISVLAPDLYNGGPFDLLGIPDQQLRSGFDRLLHRYDLEFQHISHPRQDLRVVWGAGARLDQAGSRAFFNTETNRDYIEDHVYRLFGHAEWRMTPQTIVNAGAMVEKNDITGTNIAPRLSLNHHLTPRQTVRVAWSRAFRKPALLEEHGDSVLSLQDGTPLDQDRLSAGGLDPERIDAFELAHLARLPAYGLQTEIKLFHERIRDIIVEAEDEMYSDPINDVLAPFGIAIPGDVFFYENNGHADRTGLELQASLHPTPRTRVHLGHSIVKIRGRYLREINDDTVGTKFQDVHGATPGTTTTLQLIQDFGKGLKASVAGHYLGHYEFEGGDPTGSFVILNLGLSKRYRFGQQSAELAVSVQNLLDDYFDYEREQFFERRIFATVKLGSF